MLREVMKRAWEIYRTLEGDRVAKLSLALKTAWKEIKEGGKKVIKIADWFLKKNAIYVATIGTNSNVDVNVLKETDKAVYAELTYNHSYGNKGVEKVTRTLWVPKSVISK